MTKFTIVGTVLFASGCAFTLPARNSGPVESKEGVQVALVNLYCSQDEGPEWMNYADDQVILHLKISNRTSSPVLFHRDRVHLITRDSWTPKDQSWHSDRPIAVDSGKEAVTSVDFLSPDPEACDEDLRLDLDDAVTVGDEPVPLEPIRFVAELAQ
jgi:hypothetical protein